MEVVYPVIFTQTKDENDTFLISIPDIDGATEGFGLLDSIEMAKDYIGNFLCEKSDSDIPAATEITEIDAAESEFANAGKSFVSLVDVDLDAFRRRAKGKTVRRNITLPEWLDDMATSAKVNVSAIAQRALCSALGVASC